MVLHSTSTQKPYELVAGLLPEGASILDFTSGIDALAHTVSPRFRYKSCNVTEEELPVSTDATHIFMLGILAQVENWQGLLAYSRALNRPVFLSYPPADLSEISERTACGYANHLTLDQFRQAVREFDFHIQSAIPLSEREALFCLAPADSAQPALCPVCESQSRWFKAIDFHWSAPNGPGARWPDSGILIRYAHCPSCAHTFAPEMLQWSDQEFATRIYNDRYGEVDPEYREIRPINNAYKLVQDFGTKPEFRHLDFGGGNGLLSRVLCNVGWNSVSCDPFANADDDPNSLGLFDLITAFEVFEHVPDPHALIQQLKNLLAPGGVILFSTLLSDGNIHPDQDLSWWYVLPRNGHINLFSQQSLSTLAKHYGLNLFSFSPGFHAMFQSVPDWARDILPPSQV